MQWIHGNDFLNFFNLGGKMIGSEITNLHIIIIFICICVVIGLYFFRVSSFDLVDNWTFTLVFIFLSLNHTPIIKTHIQSIWTLTSYLALLFLITHLWWCWLWFLISLEEIQYCFLLHWLLIINMLKTLKELLMLVPAFSAYYLTTEHLVSLN